MKLKDEIKQNLDEFAREFTARQLVWGFAVLQGLINAALVIWNYRLTHRLNAVEAVAQRWAELLGN